MCTGIFICMQTTFSDALHYVYKGRPCCAQVRKIKRRGSEYDYVEVMACPSGCLNGGGQIRPASGQTPQQLIDELDAIYHDPQASFC